MLRCFINLSFLIVIAVFPVVVPPAFAANPMPVFVSILPQQYFVQQIGKDLVSVEVMVQPGASPATYEPKPRQMAALSAARIYFAVGVPFENAWLKKIAAANPDMMIVRTDQGIPKRSMTTPHGHEAARHDDSDHRAGAPDPHIWLSPPLVMIQARSILTALLTADPSHRSIYEENYRIFLSELHDLDDELRAVFKEKQGMQFLVFHPSWGYFAETYGLRQVPLEIEGKDPKPARLRELIAHAREHHIKVVFVQPQFSSRSARQVAREIGGQVVAVDPLALNWSENLREVARKFNTELR